MTDARKGPWVGVNELLWQLRDIRGQCPNSGFSFYSSSCFDKIGPQLKDSLQQTYTKNFALIPPMPWLDSTLPAAPILSGTTNEHGVTLKWQAIHQPKKAERYVVYRFTNNEPHDLERSDRIISVQQSTEFTDPMGRKYKHCSYVVTALDRLWNESKPSNKVNL